jgi:hypothetical protein
MTQDLHPDQVRDRAPLLLGNTAEHHRFFKRIKLDPEVPWPRAGIPDIRSWLRERDSTQA